MDGTEHEGWREEMEASWITFHLPVPDSSRSPFPFLRDHHIGCPRRFHCPCHSSFGMVIPPQSFFPLLYRFPQGWTGPRWKSESWQRHCAEPRGGNYIKELPSGMSAEILQGRDHYIGMRAKPDKLLGVPSMPPQSRECNVATPHPLTLPPKYAGREEMEGRRGNQSWQLCHRHPASRRSPSQGGSLPSGEPGVVGSFVP